jgi:glycine cleavage system H protein
MAVNEQLTSRPHLLKQDPYGKGWVLAIELSAMEELKQLLSPEQYGKHMDESLFIY